MAADLAMELKPKNVTMVSLWPGPVRYNVFVLGTHCVYQEVLTQVLW